MCCLMITYFGSDHLPNSGHSLLTLSWKETLELVFSLIYNNLTITTSLAKLKPKLGQISSVMKSSLHSSLKFDLIDLVVTTYQQSSYCVNHNFFYYHHIVQRYNNNRHFQITFTNTFTLSVMISFIHLFLGLIIGNSVIPSYGHPCVAEDAEDKIDAFLEKPLFSDVKVWHLVMMGFCVVIIATIVACCIMRCRIPRTKQEIEADAVRKKVTKQFRAHLNKLPSEGLQLLTVLDQVKKYEEERVNAGEEEEKKTFWKRFKSLFKSNKQDSLEKSVSKDDEDDAGEEGSTSEKPGLTHPKLTNTIVSITSETDQITVSSPTPSVNKEKY